MKKNVWLVCGLMLTSGLLAQQATNTTAIPGPITATPVAPVAAAPATTVLMAPATAAVATNTPSATKAKKKSGKKKAPGTAKKNGKKAAVKKPSATVVAKAKPAPAPAAAPELKTVPLVPGPATVAASHVNVRGQSNLKGEVIGHLAQGNPVTVIEEIILKKSGPDEPSAWAKIALPASIHTWINASFVDSNKTVTAKRLNLRGGAGENYSVLGRVERGDIVKEVATKGDWMEIEAPTNAYAYVAAVFLKQEEPAAPAAAPAVTAPAVAAAATPVAPAPVPAVTPAPVVIPTNTPTVAAVAPAVAPPVVAPPVVITPLAPAPVTPLTDIPKPPPPVTNTPAPVVVPPAPMPAPEPATTTVVAAPPVVPPAPVEANPPPPVVPAVTPAVPAVPAEPTPAPVPVPAPTPTVAAVEPAPAEPKADEPPAPRVVQREGIVRGMTSIQAPSPYALTSLDTRRNIDYLYTASTNLDLSRYKGAHVIVIGEEYLDSRWGNTPVIDIQRLTVLTDADK